MQLIKKHSYRKTCKYRTSHFSSGYLILGKGGLKINAQGNFFCFTPVQKQVFSCMSGKVVDKLLKGGISHSRCLSL